MLDSKDKEEEGGEEVDEKSDTALATALNSIFLVHTQATRNCYLTGGEKMKEQDSPSQKINGKGTQ